MLNSRSETLPASCYDTCNYAYLEAQHTGETPALCEPGSAFNAYIASCRNCSSESIDWDDMIKDTPFGPYLDYCNTLNSTISPISTSSIGYYTIVSLNVTYTATIEGIPTTWSQPIVTTSFAVVPATAVFTVLTTLDSGPQTFTFTTTYDPLPSNFAEGMNNVTSNGTGATVPKPTNTDVMDFIQPHSRAWVAGPIVGGVAGLLIAGIGSFLLWRRRRRRFTDIELHGDSAIKSEMEVPNHPHELEAGVPLAQDHEPQELPAERN
ncbi:hypothetical protein F4821DRAFT_244870, partial [Hypoxylon rubiginosum]